MKLRYTVEFKFVRRRHNRASHYVPNGLSFSALSLEPCAESGNAVAMASMAALFQ